MLCICTLFLACSARAFRRSLSQVKSSYDDEALVTGYEPGKGKHVGRTGSLVCRSRTGRIFKIGTGLSDAEREAPPPVGSVVTYTYNELTKVRGGPLSSLSLWLILEVPGVPLAIF